MNNTHMGVHQRHIYGGPPGAYIRWATMGMPILTSSKFKYIHLETNSQSQYWYFLSFARLVSNAFLFVCTIFNIYSCVLQLIFVVYGILQNLYRILHLTLSLIYFKLRYNLYTNSYRSSYLLHEHFYIVQNSNYVFNAFRTKCI